MSRTVDELQLRRCEPRIPPARADTLRRRWAALGVALVLAALGLAQHAIWDFDDRYWPVVVIVAGLYLVTIGALIARPGCQWAAVGGSMLVIAGGVLQYQAITHRWASWTYAWPLVVLLALGVGLVVSARAKWADESAEALGIRLMWAGGLVAAILFLVLEGIVGLGDLWIHQRLPLLLPTVLATAGVVAAVRGRRSGTD